MDLDFSAYDLEELVEIVSLSIVNKAYSLVKCNTEDETEVKGRFVCAQSNRRVIAILADTTPDEKSLENLERLKGIPASQRIFVYTRQPPRSFNMQPLIAEMKSGRIELWAPSSIADNLSTYGPHLIGFLYMVHKCQTSQVLELTEAFKQAMLDGIDHKTSASEPHEEFAADLTLMNTLWELKDNAVSLHKALHYASEIIAGFENGTDTVVSTRLLVILPRYVSEFLSKTLPRLSYAFRSLAANYSELVRFVMSGKYMRSPIYNMPFIHGRLRGHLPNTGVPAVSEQLRTDLTILKELTEIGDARSADYSAISILDGAVSFMSLLSQIGNGFEFFVDAVFDFVTGRKDRLSEESEDPREILIELMSRFSDTRASTLPPVSNDRIRQMVRNMSDAEVARRLREYDFSPVEVT